MHTKTLQDQIDAGRNKGVSTPFGKILKGTISQAPIKLNVASIPTKYQNIIFKPHSKPAFGDSKIRFFQLSAQDTSQTPGPGCYNLNNSFSKVQSKKGSGFFASQSKLDKLQRARSHGPGPGAYKVRQSKARSLKKLNYSKFKLNQSQLNSSKSTALLSSHIQNSRQIFKKQIQNSKNKPSVGAYQINPQKILKLKSSYSTFKSKIQRFSIRQSEIPPLGIYQIFNRPKPSKSDIEITKKFKYKKDSQYTHQRSIHKAFLNLQKQEQKQKIGPGAYNPLLNSTSKTFKIKDNMHDRFGELKPIYLMAKTVETKDKIQKRPERPERPQLNRIQMAKTYNSIFKSTTQRWDIKLKGQMDPGTYNPNKSPPKKSHLINFLQKWV